MKLNCVLLAGLNEDQLLPIVRYAAKRDVVVRFIELMPFARTAGLDEENFFPVGKAMARLAEAGELVALPDFRPGHGPAVYYEFRPLNGRVGFIGAMTTPHFCASCNKLRLTADGKLRPCLGRHGEIDLLAALRGGGGAADVLRAAVANKPEDHEFLRNSETTRPMTAIGG